VLTCKKQDDENCRLWGRSGCEACIDTHWNKWDGDGYVCTPRDPNCKE